MELGLEFHVPGFRGSYRVFLELVHGPHGLGRCGRILAVEFMNDLCVMFFKEGLEGKVQLV